MDMHIRGSENSQGSFRLKAVPNIHCICTSVLEALFSLYARAKAESVVSEYAESAAVAQEFTACRSNTVLPLNSMTRLGIKKADNKPRPIVAGSQLDQPMACSTGSTCSENKHQRGRPKSVINIRACGKRAWWWSSPTLARML